MVSAALERASTTIAHALLPRSLPEMVDLSERIAKSTLLPTAMRGKPVEVLMQLLTGHELGLSPMASLRAFYIVDGKVCMAADTMVALVLRSGACRYFRRARGATDKAVTYITRRGDGEEVGCTWTIEMARTASLHMRDNWRGYPRAMLAARAKAELARSEYPDVLAGIYTPDELGVADAFESHDADEAMTDEVGAPEPSVDADDALPAPSEPAPTAGGEPYPELAALDTATSVAQLKTVAASLVSGGIDGEAREQAIARYNARLDWLRRHGGRNPREAS